MAERIRADRWEHGSDFDLDMAVGSVRYPWDGGPVTLWGSGRAAMRGLLAFGRERGWRRLHVPSYMCQHVAFSLAREIELVAYPCDPLDGPRGPVRTRPGDAVLVIHAYGRRVEPAVAGPAVTIEDVTHDPLAPWVAGSGADYTVASLRKVLPLPEGGVLWSPRGLDLPAERPVTARHGRVVMARLAAMTLKRLYLDGAAVAKDAYRSLALAGEAAMDQGAISGMTPYSRQRMATFPVGEWREQKRANIAAFAAALGEPPGVRFLDVPFAATLAFTSAELREQVRRRLVAARIYPAVLWPLEAPIVRGIPARDVDLSRRLLTLHADQRYGAGDMERVADEIRRAVIAG